jgi:hypothetical protein
MNDLWWLIILLIGGGVLWFMNGGPQKIQSAGGIKTYLNPPNIGIPMNTPSGSSGNKANPVATRASAPAVANGANSRPTPKPTPKPTPTVNPNDSQYKGKITLRVGTARSGNNSSQEYVYITAQKNNSGPIVVSGWQLKNDQSEIFYSVNGQNVPGQDTVVSIPQGIKLETFKVGDAAGLGPIILKPGDTVIVVTGNPPSVSPQIAYNFQVNKCSGYIDDLPYHALTPRISYSCPRVQEEYSFDQFSQDCIDFMTSHYGTNCHTPVIKQDSKQGDLFDGKSLSQYCKTYILQHFNYDSCLANHKTDTDFYKPEWRIYLNRVWPLWSNTKEKITLMDNYGKIVDQISYGY